MALVHEWTVLTQWLPLLGEVTANFCRQRVSRGQRNGSPLPYSWFSRPEPLLFLPSSSSIALTRLSGPHFIRTTSQKIWKCLELNPGQLDLQPGTLTTRPQRRSIPTWKTTQNLRQLSYNYPSRARRDFLWNYIRLFFLYKFTLFSMNWFHSFI
jgi:hypothetical protein